MISITELPFDILYTIFDYINIVDVFTLFASSDVLLNRILCESPLHDLRIYVERILDGYDDRELNRTALEKIIKRHVKKINASDNTPSLSSDCINTDFKSMIVFSDKPFLVIDNYFVIMKVYSDSYMIYSSFSINSIKFFARSVTLDDDDEPIQLTPIFPNQDLFTNENLVGIFSVLCKTHICILTYDTLTIYRPYISTEKKNLTMELKVHAIIYPIYGPLLSKKVETFDVDRNLTIITIGGRNNDRVIYIITNRSTDSVENEKSTGKFDLSFFPLNEPYCVICLDLKIVVTLDLLKRLTIKSIYAFDPFYKLKSRSIDLSFVLQSYNVTIYTITENIVVLREQNVEEEAYYANENGDLMGDYHEFNDTDRFYIIKFNVADHERHALIPLIIEGLADFMKVTIEPNSSSTYSIDTMREQNVLLKRILEVKKSTILGLLQDSINSGPTIIDNETITEDKPIKYKPISIHV